MINLLPDNSKNELRAARNNVLLLQYNFIALIAIGILVVACGIFYAILLDTRNTDAQNNDQNTRDAANYSDVKKEADEYRTNLETAKKILANQVDYTDIVFKITSLLPSGITLDNLNLTAATFDAPTVIAVHAKSYDAATKLKQNFENSKLFSDVHFESITDTTTGTENSVYPYTVNISVTINKVTD